MIVVSSDCMLTDEAIVMHNPRLAMIAAKILSKRTGADIVIMGGSAIYGELASEVDELILTVIEDKKPEADTFFPMEKFQGEWALTGVMGHVTTNCGKSGTIIRKTKKIG